MKQRVTISYASFLDKIYTHHNVFDMFIPCAAGAWALTPTTC